MNMRLIGAPTLADLTPEMVRRFDVDRTNPVFTSFIPARPLISE